jgi:hypothetical protein
MRIILVISMLMLMACSSSQTRESFTNRCKKDYISWQKNIKRNVSLEEAEAWCAYEQIRRDDAIERRIRPRERFL